VADSRAGSCDSASRFRVRILPWAGTSRGPQAFLDNLGAIFSRWENQGVNVTSQTSSARAAIAQAIAFFRQAFETA
jgi:hypothetical protein